MVMCQPQAALAHHHPSLIDEPPEVARYHREVMGNYKVILQIIANGLILIARILDIFKSTC